MLLILGGVAVFFDPYYDWLSHVIGGVAGFSIFYGIHALFYYGFKKDALGGGDIKLSGAVGLLLGWERLLLGVVIASLSASIVLLLLNRRSSETDEEASTTEPEEGEALPGEYPFAPFLCSGFWIAMMFGSQIITWYISLFGI